MGGAMRNQPIGDWRGFILILRSGVCRGTETAADPKSRLGFRVKVLMDRCPKIEYQRLAI
jgi:hypothetical protein